MLKTISTQQVRLGMFIHALKGAWIDHPFWRKSFVLTDTETLSLLLASNIKELIIDTAKGLDVEDLSTSEHTDKLKAIVDSPITLSSDHVAVVSVAPNLENPPKIARIAASEERDRASKILLASKAAVTSMFDEVRMGKAVDANSVLPLVNEITSSISRNESALISLVRLKNRDEYTYMHSVAVCALMIALAKELGLNEEEVRLSGMAGLLHDIGKMAVNPDILNKPGALTDSEFDLVRMHPEKGYEILKQGKNISEMALDVCLHHHEKIDGSGYPKKLQGNQISLYAKMGAVCDVYDAITSNRPYKAGWEPSLSLHRMAQWSNHFDDVVFKAFVKSVGIYPIGAMVQLKSGRLGVVIDQSPQSLLTPIVRVFFSTRTKTRIAMEDIDLSKPHCDDKIIKNEDPRTWGIENVNEIWSQ